jgi:hypothetical protein
LRYMSELTDADRAMPELTDDMTVADLVDAGASALRERQAIAVGECVVQFDALVAPPAWLVRCAGARIGLFMMAKSN